MDVIKVENFCKSFGSKVVHNGVSLTVKKGECVGLIGGSGVGKSVILRSMIGLERPDDGKIYVNGEEITKYSEDELVNVRKKVAYVFQNGALFDSMSVYENLAYPLREHTQLTENQIGHKIKEKLDEFGLSGNKELYPAHLSGGMQKRVGLARAIILGPEIILYDEPTAGLDPFNTRKIQEMILRLKSKGVSSILVTHDMPSALITCDRLAILVGGRIHAEISCSELKKNTDNVFQKFINGEI